MENLIIFIVILIVLLPIVYFWVKGIDYMHKNYPDYKGEDLFGENEEEKT